MSDLLELFELSVQLREVHATIKRLYGERFDQWVTDIGEALKQRAPKHDGNIFAAAIHWAKEPHVVPQFALLILAVAVELKLRANQPAKASVP